MKTQTYTVDGMDCAGCAQSVGDGVRRLAGVSAAEIDFTTCTLRVTGDVDVEAVRERVAALGYSLRERGAEPAAAPNNGAESRGGVRGFWLYLWRRPDTRLALAGAGLAAIGGLGLLAGAPAALADALLVIALLLTAWPIARSGLRTLLINRTFTINLLMTIAALGALAIGEFLEAATVIILFAVGEALEGYTADRARQSLRSLLALAPNEATRLVDGRTEQVAVKLLAVGDTILVRPGERIPLDGVVSAGAGGVDQSPITGESMPVYKTVGDEVWAGTVAGAESLEVRVTRLSADTTLSRIIRLVEEAQGSRAASQRVIDRFARWYTPAMLGLAIIVAVVPPLFGGAWGTWFYRALALLVIACPCALVISAPVTIISGITAAARRGILIKGGLHLETLGSIRAVAFDKTGTLTRGEPTVTACRSLDCESGAECAQCDDILALASAVERGSAHPLARAVVKAAEHRQLAATYAPANGVTALAGRGVQGQINGKWVTVGNHALFDAEHPHPAAVCALVAETEARGQTAMLLCDGDRVRGLLAVADSVRPESAAIVADLKALDLTPAMLTGDNPTVAGAVGAQLGIGAIHAGLLPADKVATVRDLQQRYGPVAMIGDGINDTPALATANVGIAVGGAGSAQAMETADIVLMADSLGQLPFAFRVSRFVRRLIRQNVLISVLTKVLFIGLALAGMPSLWLAILADVGVSLVVTVNGMRPLRLAPAVA